MKRTQPIIIMLLLALCLASFPTITNTMDNENNGYFRPSFVLKCLGTAGITFFIYKLLHINRTKEQHTKEQRTSEKIKCSEIVQQSCSYNNEWVTNIFNQNVYNNYDNINIHNSYGGVYVKGWMHEYTSIVVTAKTRNNSLHNNFTLYKELNNKTLNISTKVCGKCFLELQINLPQTVNVSTINVDGNITLSNITASKNYKLCSK